MGILRYLIHLSFLYMNVELMRHQCIFRTQRLLDIIHQETLIPKQLIMNSYKNFLQRIQLKLKMQLLSISLPLFLLAGDLLIHWIA